MAARAERIMLSKAAAGPFMCCGSTPRNMWTIGPNDAQARVRVYLTWMSSIRSIPSNDALTFWVTFLST